MKSMRHAKRFASMAALLSMAGLVMTGCASTGGGNPNQLVVQYQTGGSETAIMKAWIKLFNAKYPDIKVKLQGLSNQAKQNTNLQTLTSNNAPDVAVLPLESTAYSQLSKSHQLVSLAPVFDSQDLKARMGAGVVAADSYEGVPVAVSSNASYYTFAYYNVDLFKRYNIPEPVDHRFSSMDEFLGAVKVLKQHGVEGMAVGAADNYQSSWMIDSTLPNTSSASQYENFLTNWQTKVKPTVKYTDPPFVESVQRVKDLADAGAFQSGYLGATVAQASSLFQQGKAGLTLDGSWNAQTYEKAGFAYDWALLPPVNADQPMKLISYLGDAFGIPKKAKNPEAAQNFLKIMMSVEGQAALVPAGLIPIVNDVPEADTAKLPTAVRQMLSDSAHNGSAPGWSNVVPSTVGANFIEPPLQEMLNGTGTPLSVAEQVQQALVSTRAQ